MHHCFSSIWVVKPYEEPAVGELRLTRCGAQVRESACPVWRALGACNAPKSARQTKADCSHLFGEATIMNQAGNSCWNYLAKTHETVLLTEYWCWSSTNSHTKYSLRNTIPFASFNGLDIVTFYPGRLSPACGAQIVSLSWISALTVP